MSTLEETTNFALYQTLIYAVDLPLSLLIVITNCIFVLVFLKNASIFKTSAYICVYLCALGVTNGILHFIGCICVNIRKDLYTNYKYAIFQHILFSVVFLSYAFSLLFISFQRYIMSKIDLTKRKKKLCVYLLCITACATVLVLIPMGSKQHVASESVPLMFGAVQARLGTTNSLTTVLLMYLFAFILSAIIYLCLGIKYANQISPSTVIIKEEGCQGDEAHAKSEKANSNAVTNTQPNNQANANYSNFKMAPSPNPQAQKISNKRMSQAFALLTFTFFLLWLPYSLIQVALIFAVDDPLLNAFEICTFYIGYSQHVVSLILFMLKLSFLRSQLWRLLC